MPVLATWIREKDEPSFARWLGERPELEVRNARLPAPADESTTFSQMDGLLLTGGPDISAGYLRQPVTADAPIQEPEPERDRWEFAAVRAALDRGLPILAICKGHQVLNVALGGTLALDIRGHDDPAYRSSEVQPLRYAAGVTAPRYERVNSSHHQAINLLGHGLEVEAWHAGDGVIEQVRLAGYQAGCLGVQYHPERGEQYAGLFADFFNRMTGDA